MGQPLHPLPLAFVLLRAKNCHAQGLRRAQRRHVHDHGPHLSVCRLLRTSHLDMTEVAKHDSQRHVVDHRVGVDETPHR